MSGLTALLGETLISKAGPIEVSSLAKAGHVVGLYFSAHWCPPCLKFTQLLARWYKAVKDSDVGSKLEIVFISSDDSEEEFDQYYGEMPWTAIPYEEADDKETELSTKFKSKGIPSLIFIAADTGKLLNKKGRTVVGLFKEGDQFPWLPKSVAEILPGPVISNAGEVDIGDVTKGKFLGIYFSAHWCGPCREFTPKLIETYNKLKEDGKNFEIVFASSDENAKGFEDYYKDMPWLAFPLNDHRAGALDEHFKVYGIPTLVILDENLETITDEGYSAVMADPEGKKFPWIQSPLQELSDMNVYLKYKSLVFFTDGKKDLIAQAQSLMQEVAEEMIAATKTSQGTDDELDPIWMIYEGTDGCEKHVTALRQNILLETPAPCLVYISLFDEVKHVIENPGDLTKEDLKDIVSKVRNGAIETVPIPRSLTGSQIVRKM